MSCGTLAIRWHPQNIYGYRPRGTAKSGGGLNAREVAKYSNFGPIEGFISEIGGKLVLITNIKSYMSFRLVQKLLTLNGVMAIILCYFAELGSFRGTFIKVVEDISKHSATKL